MCSAAHASSASALVPCMSELKPPSQNSPGAPPARARTAMLRRPAPEPTSMKAGGGEEAVELVMKSALVCCCLREQRASVNGRRYRLGRQCTALAELTRAL